LGDQCSAKLTITNKYGLHARPATDFAQSAMEFASDIRVITNAENADGKSIMELMMLAATQGTVIEVVCKGKDAKEALDHLASMINRGFDEEDD
jgi:phosphocarrier protein HPr